MAAPKKVFSAPFRIRYTDKETRAIEQAKAKLDDPNVSAQGKYHSQLLIDKLQKKAAERTEKRKEIKAAARAPRSNISKRDPAERQRASEFLDAYDEA